MAYHLTGDVHHAERCRQEMLAAARFSDWNPSHFLDVAEMTFALAIGYDWLYDQLDEASRKEIRTAIVEKGVAVPFETKHNGWVRAHNNWGQVCHGGLTAGALAVLEDEPDLAARTVHNALQNVVGFDGRICAARQLSRRAWLLGIRHQLQRIVDRRTRKCIWQRLRPLGCPGIRSDGRLSGP